MAASPCASTRKARISPLRWRRPARWPCRPISSGRRGRPSRTRRITRRCSPSHEGAVAAPTAGLHFTPALLAALDARGIGARDRHAACRRRHVPARARGAMWREHRMHAERGIITSAGGGGDQRARVRQAGGSSPSAPPALRLLETAADTDGLLRPFAGETDIFILPGYRFRVVDLLLTNFHLPRSTLFMLVCRLLRASTRMRAAYAHAIAHRLPLLFLWRRLACWSARMSLTLDASRRQTAPPAPGCCTPRMARCRRRPSCRWAPPAR